MAGKSHEPLLSEKNYDKDAPTVSSDPEDDAVSDSEAESIGNDPVADDRLLLEEPEEEARLLSQPSRFDAVRQALKHRENHNPDQIEERRKRNLRRVERLKRQAQNNGDSEVVYEMEEGFKDTSSTSSSDYDVPMKDWGQKGETHLSFARLLPYGAVISIIFVALFFGSYRASKHDLFAGDRTYHNGTHLFSATTILISLDGFRADFLQRSLTPAMNAFIQSGVSPKYMLPCFPSVTFPNHYSIVTGLHPESHGIVSNQFWDPELQEEFYYTDIANSMRSKWWEAAEPLWVTAKKQGIKTAVHMWPGSEANIHGVDPTYLDKFNEKEPLPNKVNRIMQWLDFEQEHRPQLIAAYVPNVDADGHKYGPNSTEIRETIADADRMLTLLVDGLLQRNLTEIVNIIIVSDHGMATTSTDRLVQLDDIIDLSLVDHIDGWPLRGLRLKNPNRDVPILHEQLSKAAQAAGTFDVYTLDTMPERYHFRNNPRIAPLWVVPKTGWAVVERHDFDVQEAKKTGQDYEPKGLHGYDHEHPLMRAVFVARGPAFPHAGNSRVPVFQNIEVYNIVCDSIGMVPHPNNGTLRLPLVTQGLHSDFDDDVELPTDPVLTNSASNHPGETNTAPASIVTSAAPSGAIEGSADSGSQQPDELDRKGKWWEFIHEQLEKAKEWAKQVLETIKDKTGPKDSSVK